MPAIPSSGTFAKMGPAGHRVETRSERRSVIGKSPKSMRLPRASLGSGPSLAARFGTFVAFRTSLVRDEVQPPCGHQCACRPILATRFPPRVHALLGNKRRLENPGCQCQPIQIRPKFSDGLVTPAQAKSQIIVN